MLYATNISEVAWDFISPIFEKARACPQFAKQPQVMLKMAAS
jgi:hypothetical protein